MYNPLQFFKPVNARFDLAGQMATQISEQNRLRGDRAKQQAGEQRFLGLQQLGQYQPKELEDPQVQGQMEQAKMDMLGGGDKYLNYQIGQQKMEADALYRKNKMEADALYREQQLKGDAGTPKIAQYIGLQTDAIESAENVLQKYLAIDKPTPEQKEKARIDYGHSWRANREAMAQLGGHANATGQDYTKLPTWGKALKDGITFGSAEELNNSLIRKANAQASSYEAAASDAYAGISRAKELHDKKISEMKKGTASERLTAGFAQRMVAADAAIRGKQPSFWQTVGAKVNKATGKSDNAYFINADDFVASNLRKESGAAIGQDEKDNAYSRYVPKFGDSAEAIETKARIRKQMIDDFIKASGSAYTPKDGSKTKTVSEVEQALIDKYSK
jgi:hypothetical protein